jgi:hypothetical protein
LIVHTSGSGLLSELLGSSSKFFLQSSLTLSVLLLTNSRTFLEFLASDS